MDATIFENNTGREYKYAKMLVKVLTGMFIIISDSNILFKSCLCVEAITKIVFIFLLWTCIHS